MAGYVSITGTYNGEGGGEDPPEITLFLEWWRDIDSVLMR